MPFYGPSVVIGNFTDDTKPDVLWFSSSKNMYLGINNTTTADDITFSSIDKLSNTLNGGRTGYTKCDYLPANYY